jgi:hypothetical protein
MPILYAPAFDRRGDGRPGLRHQRGRSWRRYGLLLIGAVWPARLIPAYIVSNTPSDRGTWLSFQNKRALVVVVEGDLRLINRYDVILLNPSKHPVPKQALAERSLRRPKPPYSG